MANYCPDCGTPLREPGRKCSCGWKEPKAECSAAETAPGSSLGCRSAGCPMPSVWGDSPTGGTQWCRWHTRARANGASPQEMQQISDDLRNNPPQPEIDWRDVLMSGHANAKQKQQDDAA